MNTKKKRRKEAQRGNIPKFTQLWNGSSWLKNKVPQPSCQFARAQNGTQYIMGTKKIYFIGENE